MSLAGWRLPELLLQYLARPPRFGFTPLQGAASCSGVLSPPRGGGCRESRAVSEVRAAGALPVAAGTPVPGGVAAAGSHGPETPLALGAQELLPARSTNLFISPFFTFSCLDAFLGPRPIWDN